MPTIRPPSASGTLDASGVAVVQAPYILGATSYTCTLKSGAGGRKIELSTDGGAEYFMPTYDVSSGTMLVVGLLAPVTHVKFTGAQTDTWSIL